MLASSALDPLCAAITVTSDSLAPSDRILTSYTVGYDNFGDPFRWIGDSGGEHRDIAQSFLVFDANDWIVDKITLKAMLPYVGKSVPGQGFLLEMWTVSDAADWSGNELVSSQSGTFPTSGLTSAYWTFDIADVSLAKEQYYAFVLGFESGPDPERFVSLIQAYSAYDYFPEGRMFLRIGTPTSWSSPYYSSDKDFEFYVQGDVVPEPSTFAVFAVGAACVGAWRWWNRRKTRA